MRLWAALPAAILLALGITHPAFAADALLTGDEPDAENVNESGAVVVLEDVKPAAITSDTESFTLSGSVTNTGNDPLDTVNVQPRWSATPLASRDEIATAVDDPSFNPGLRYEEPFHRVGDIDPGESFEFEVTFDDAALEQMTFPTDGVYVIGVEVLAGDAEGVRDVVAADRTVVPYLAAKDDLQQVPVSVLWPVSAQPSLLPDGTLIDESFASEVKPGGRLDTMLRIGQEANGPLSWLVDADTLQTADAMADGYEVRDGADTVPGNSASEAATWRSLFETATSDADLSMLPTAQPDVAAIAAKDAGLARNIADLAVTDSRNFAASGRTGTAWLPGENVDTEAVSTYAAAGVETFILRDTALDATATASSLDDVAGDARAVTTDSGLDATFNDEDPLSIRQRWAAETALASLEASALGTSPQPLLTAPPSGWLPDPTTAIGIVDAWASTDWIDQVPLEEILDIENNPSATLAERGSGRDLPNENVDALRALADDSRAYLSLLDDGDDIQQQLDGGLMRAASATWRQDPAAGREFTQLIDDEVAGNLDGVTVITRETVTLTSGSGVFPLTVENTLDAAVTVKLQLSSSNSDRLLIHEVDPLVVQPGESQTVDVSAEANANGRVPVTVQLLSAGGSAIGKSHQTVVNATEYGTIAWVIVAGAGILLGVGVARRILAGKTRRSDGDSLEMSSGEAVEKVPQ